MIANLLSMMIDRALQNRENALLSMREVRQGTYDQSVARKRAQSPPKRRRVSKYAKELGKQWKIVKKRSRKKNGEYRSGWNQAKELSQAHRATKKKLK